jgi:hypothetical protein
MIPTAVVVGAMLLLTFMLGAGLRKSSGSLLIVALSVTCIIVASVGRVVFESGRMQAFAADYDARAISGEVRSVKVALAGLFDDTDVECLRYAILESASPKQ